MTREPKISVVTPTYNSETTILRTVESVILQELDQIEYIVIDACSTDSTKEQISRYKDLVTFVSEPDDGIFDGMNKGVRLCRGKIVGIINSDDWYLSGSLQEVWNKFQSWDCDVLIGGVDVYQYTHKIGSRNHTIEELESNMVSHPAVFVKRKVYEELGGFNLTYRVAADYDFLLRARKAGYKFSVIQNSLSAYSLGGYSDSPRARLVSIFETEKIRNRHGVVTKAHAFWNALFISVKTICRRDHKFQMARELIPQITTFWNQKAYRSE